MINFFTLDINGILTYANINDARHLRRIVPGRNLWHEYPEEVGTAFYDACLKVLDDQKRAMLEIYYSPDETWWERYIYPVDGGLAVYCKEISEKKRIEEKLRLSQANLDATINHPDLLIWSLDRSLNFISFNKHLVNYVEEHLKESFQDKPSLMTDGLAWHAPNQNRWRGVYQRVLSGESLLFEETKFGLDFQYSLRPIIKNGAIIGVSAFACNVTARNLRQRELADANKRIDNLKLAVWRSAIDAHFIFSTLNSIQHYIIHNEKENAINYVASFAKLIRAVLNSTVAGGARLDEELELIRNYVSLEQMAEANKFEFNFSVSPDVDLQEKIPAMIIQPYVENAIAHGLRNRTGEGHGVLTISVENDSSHLAVRIEDNGIGRKAAMERQQSGGYTTTSSMITEERLRLMKSEEAISITIIDKMENGEASGTIVVLSISHRADG